MLELISIVLACLSIALTLDIYLDELQIALQKSSDLGYWHNFSWEYNPVIEGETDGK